MTRGQLDALLPPEMAKLAEEVGVRKAALGAWSTVTLAVLAGAFISLGAVFSTVALAGAGDAPWGGMTRLLAGVVFSLGLILVIVGGAELNWLLVYVGNFVGALATAFIVYVARAHEFGGGALGAAALGIASAKSGALVLASCGPRGSLQCAGVSGCVVDLQCSRLAREHGLLVADHAELTRHPAVVERLGRIVEAKNAAPPSYARIKRFAVLPVDFTEAGGELTPTQKVKRKVVAGRYGDVIESLYR